MKIEEFIEITREHLKKEKLLDKSGSVLYSSYKTIQKGDFYLIGLNPGGSAEQNPHETILKSLNELEKDIKIKKDYNAYTDESWDEKQRPEKVGNHPLQRRIKFLMKELNLDIKKVCSSNLIFTRSSGQDGSNYPENANKCWPIHEMILKIVKPIVILTFGNGLISPYDYLWKKHFEQNKQKPIEQDPMKAGHRNWKYKCFNFESDYLKCLVLGIPHLSRLDIISNKRQELLRMVKEKWIIKNVRN
jgi:hypothetical protein